ncbi:MAG TPA: hypothetical protein VF756_26245 [Thermoanaerobaculia bacterium]
MTTSTGAGRTTTRRTPALGLLILTLALAGCASSRRAPQPAPTPPQPSSVPSPEPDRGGRFPRYVEPIKQISLRNGHFGWGGLEMGMTFEQAERVLGRRLPSLGSASQDELCGYYHLEVDLMRQPLRLEFAAEGGESRLKAIWLTLRNPEGTLSKEEIARALRARFPDLVYVPSPHVPDVAEEANPKPLYQLPPVGSEMFFVDPQQGGVYFGEICVD